MENPRRKRLAHINLIPEDSNMFEALNKFMHLDKNIWQKDAAVDQHGRWHMQKSSVVCGLVIIAAV